MNRILPLTLFAFLFFAKTFAQPQPCGPEPAMTPTCIEACVICDIDGYTGINDNLEQGEAPPGFCTTTLHHAQWIAFIAGSTSLTIEMQVFNCQYGSGFINGLEVGIYESLDCENFKIVSNCEGDIYNNTTGVFTTTQPLTIGQYYYWVMDGNGGDICNYKIKVTEGTTQVPPLPPAGNILDNTSPCLGDTSTYAITPISGANFYQWKIDGQSTTTTSSNFKVKWTTPGPHEVCVTAFNVCDTVAPVCLTVQAPQPIVTQVSAAICPNDCFQVGDSLLCDAGSYEILLESWQGCDSAVNATVEILPFVESSYSVNLCDDDSIEVAGQVFYPPGNFQALATSWLGCDSVINLTLNAIVCEMDGAIGASPVFCHGDQSGSIVFSVTNGTPPFSYVWKRLDGTPGGTGSLPATGTNETISGLPAGTYLITVNDGFGNDVVLNVNVYEPPPLTLDFEVSNFNGANLSCSGSQDGWVEVHPAGGNNGYTFKWSDGSAGASLANLRAGIYILTLTDANGCTTTGEVILTEPPPLTFNAVFTDPNCDGFDTGSAALENVAGGTPPYLYRLNGGNFGTQTHFTGLPGSSYDLTVLDANGCTTTQNSILKVPAIPLIEAGEDVTIKLGEITSLQVFSSVYPETITWSQQPGLSCYDCQLPLAGPFSTTTYTVAVTSVEDCTAMDSVTVNVLKIRDVYVPNAFSPNGDGINDFFTLFGGPAVKQIRQFKVFSRWGELVFKGENLRPNDPDSGWDGRFRGKEMPTGVFAWLAEVVFLDEEVVLLEGDVTLVR